jgi:hypothetical protein
MPQNLPPPIHIPPELITKYNSSQDENKRHNYQIIVVSWVTFFAVAGYAGIAYFQWRDANKNFAIDQRAWVTIKDFSLQQEPTIDQSTVNVSYSLIDSGKTPAINCVTQRIPLLWSEEPGIAHLRGQWSPDRAESTPERPIFILMPNLSSPAPDKTVPWGLAPSDVTLYRLLAFKLYVYVEVWYDDVFGKHHWMTACQEHVFGTKDNLTNFTPCQHGAWIDGQPIQ